MIIEVVVARNHVGFNERIFTKMLLTDRGTTQKERKMFQSLVFTATYDGLL